MRGIASDISNGIAYRNVSDGVANDIAHIISNTMDNYMANGLDNGKVKYIANDMANDRATGHQPNTHGRVKLISMPCLMPK